jgi:hypothetical protein
LCINVANEQLQFYFNQHIFAWELNSYGEEGIPVSEISYKDNTMLLSMVLNKPLGIFALLDEESRFPRATAASFTEKLFLAKEKSGWPNLQRVDATQSSTSSLRLRRDQAQSANGRVSGGQAAEEGQCSSRFDFRSFAPCLLPRFAPRPLHVSAALPRSRAPAPRAPRPKVAVVVVWSAGLLFASSAPQMKFAPSGLLKCLSSVCSRFVDLTLLTPLADGCSSLHRLRCHSLRQLRSSRLSISQGR